jgi:hypothetical protein
LPVGWQVALILGIWEGKMSIPKLYIETSPFNFYYSKGSKKEQDTRKLFDWVDKGRFEVYTSLTVIDELKRAEPEKREKMLALVHQYNMKILEENPDAKALATLYIKKEIIPAKYRIDALHISIASVNYLNCVVSFNFGHIVKLRALNMTGLLNVRRDYPQLGLFSPSEVDDYDGDY